MIKVTKKDLKEHRRLHDKICQTCDACSPTRCSFTEGYHRGQREYKEKLEQNIGLLRQYLNEEKITDGSRMVSSEQLKKWLLN